MTVLAKNDENIFDGRFLNVDTTCNIFDCVSMMEVFCENRKRLLAINYFRKEPPS